MAFCLSPSPSHQQLLLTLKVVQGDCLSPKGGTRSRFMAFCLSPPSNSAVTVASVSAISLSMSYRRKNCNNKIWIFSKTSRKKKWKNRKKPRKKKRKNRKKPGGCGRGIWSVTFSRTIFNSLPNDEDGDWNIRSVEYEPVLERVKKGQHSKAEPYFRLLLYDEQFKNFIFGSGKKKIWHLLRNTEQ